MPARNDPPATPTPPSPSTFAAPSASPASPSAPSTTSSGAPVPSAPPVPPPVPATPTPAPPSATPPSEPEDLDARYYQRAGQIRRALAELTNAQAAGLGTRMQAVRKELDELGYTGPETDITESGRGPIGRSTRQQRAVTTVGATTGASQSQGASNDPPPSASNR